MNHTLRIIIGIIIVFGILFFAGILLFKSEQKYDSKKDRILYTIAIDYDTVYTDTFKITAKEYHSYTFANGKFYIDDKKVIALPDGFKLFKNDSSEFVLQRTHFNQMDEIETHENGFIGSCYGCQTPAYYSSRHLYQTNIHDAKIFTDSIGAVQSAYADILDDIWIPIKAQQKRILDSIQQANADKRYTTFKQIQP